MVVVALVAGAAIGALVGVIFILLGEMRRARIAAANERAHLYSRLQAGSHVVAPGFEAQEGAPVPPGARRKLYVTEDDEVAAQLQRQREAREATLDEVARIAAEEGLAV